MTEVHSETLLAAGYAAFLIAAAILLDQLARHAQKRASRYRVGGFTYMDSVDAWECPEGERLHRVEIKRLGQFFGNNFSRHYVIVLASVVEMMNKTLEGRRSFRLNGKVKLTGEPQTA